MHTAGRTRVNTSCSRTGQPTWPCPETVSPWPYAGPCVTTTSASDGIAAHCAGIVARGWLNAPQNSGVTGLPKTMNPPRFVRVVLPISSSIPAARASGPQSSSNAAAFSSGPARPSSESSWLPGTTIFWGMCACSSISQRTNAATSETRPRFVKSPATITVAHQHQEVARSRRACCASQISPQRCSSTTGSVRPPSRVFLPSSFFTFLLVCSERQVLARPG
jgi:hypothetical protein